MKHLQPYKIFEHWKDDVQVDYHRKDDILELFYGLEDMGFNVSIYLEICSDNFGTVGKRIEFLDDSKNIYPSYRVHYRGNSSDVDDVISVKEEEITILNRLKNMGFHISILSGSNAIYLYHPDDVISKDKYINYSQVVGIGRKSKGYLMLQDTLLKLERSFSKISDISTVDNTIILKPKSDKYDIDDIENFVSKTLKRFKNCVVTKDNESVKVEVK